MTLHHHLDYTGSRWREGKDYRRDSRQAVTYGCPDAGAVAQVEHAVGHRLHRLSSEGNALRD